MALGFVYVNVCVNVYVYGFLDCPILRHLRRLGPIAFSSGVYFSPKASATPG